jgi:transcription antitermination factor NusG
LKEGDFVRMAHGPLRGVKGILVRKGNSARLVLAVQMLGRAAAVEIDSAFVEPLFRKSPDVSATRLVLATNCQTI